MTRDEGGGWLSELKERLMPEHGEIDKECSSKTGFVCKASQSIGLQQKNNTFTRLEPPIVSGISIATDLLQAFKPISIEIVV